MKRDYFNFKNSNSNINSIKKLFLGLLMILSVSFANAQSTFTIETTSNHNAWNISVQNGIKFMDWNATGAVTQTILNSNTPTFNFSSNAANGLITVQTTDTPANFNGITSFTADAGYGQQITSIDLSDLNNLEDLFLADNLLTAIDLSANTNLIELDLRRNDLTALDLSLNPNLEELKIDANLNLVNLDIGNNPKLEILEARDIGITTIDISATPDLIEIDLTNVPLTSATIDGILNQLDAFGNSNGKLYLENSTGGVITKNGIAAYISLELKGWDIRPPQGFDLGDAPDVYGTLLSSGGAVHLFDPNRDQYVIGNSKDKESAGFPSPDADGDNNFNLNDEDGVAQTEFDGIITSTTNIDIDISIINNLNDLVYVHAWLDLDGNLSFDADEYSTISIPANAGSSIYTLNWDITGLGADIQSGKTYARFRLTRDNDLTASSTTGFATGGEVEDYSFVIDEDTDNDGIPDSADLDADNDGILNTDEVGDTNGNLIDDMLELDSDDDGCLDVQEAGFTDGDGDGILGTSPVVVDANGLITDDALGPIGDGFTTPNDLDNNTIYDFQEAGATASITTEPTDEDLIIGVTTFSVVAVADSYQWQEDKQDGSGFVNIIDGGDYAGALTADLQVTNSDVTKLLYRYQVIVDNVAFACAPPITSIDVGYITPDDFDGDLIFDIVDVDDDNDGILDTDEDNGVLDRDTDGDGFPDRIDLDSDDDGCFDVDENLYDNNGVNQVGDQDPPLVDASGQVTSLGPKGGYGVPVDGDVNGTPDFQEAGAPATITTQPTDQDLIPGVATPTTFSVVSDANTYQWQEDKNDGNGFVDIIDGGDYAGATTADLVITSADFTKVRYLYRVIVSNIAYACDPTTTSVEVTFINPDDFDKDGVFDLVDEDDDNDGITDIDEDNGVVDRDTDGDGNPDRIDLDSDDDGCFDVDENLYDNNGINEVGNQNPPVVDAITGLVTSLGVNGGYGIPVDQDSSGTPDFQEAGVAPSITTEPVDQDLIIGVTTFSVVAVADTYQWEISTDGGSTWLPMSDAGDYAGTATADLMVTHADVNKLTERYRVIVDNVAFACAGPVTSVGVGYITPDDFDNDTVYDIVDIDDDNDGILDAVEDNGVLDRDTDGDGFPDRIDLDADDDGCFDVDENLYDNNGVNQVGDQNPALIDASGQVISLGPNGGYGVPVDGNVNGTPDFQEAGAAASITTQPVDQNLVPGASSTFSVVATADTYVWEESTDGGTVWNIVSDGGNYSGALTADLTVSNLDVSMVGYQYRVSVSNIAYACDPVTTSDIVSFVSLPDTDNDGVVDLIDVDDDNDGIFDTVEDNGVTDRDTDGDGIADKLQLDADADGCYDVTEAGFTDNGFGMLGNANPPNVLANGQVDFAADGYTTPNDLDNNGTPDFQETGTVANITGSPVDQDFVLGGTATYTAASDGDTYQWEISSDSVNWTPLTDDGKYSGTNTVSMSVSSLVIADYFTEYRMLTTNAAFACDPGDTSDSASYNILVDTDTDGVFDIVDDDDDNDGILDTVEGLVTDSNDDGKPDRISTNSDRDSCKDVLEAGFDDPDGDGRIGTSPVIVDANGRAIGHDFATPWDNNNNGVFDFQEDGSPSVINNQPEEVEVALGEDAVFEVTGNATYYQWQESVDGGASWNNLVNDSKYSGVDTDRLRISEARGRLEGNRYKVLLSSPDYVCDPVDVLESNDVRLVFNTELIPSGFSPNGDGENDLFSVPGLIETPAFTMEVFDRWGNSVYKYDNRGSLNPDWWDGRSTGNMTLSKGQLVPAGTYFYLIQYNDGDKSPDKGWVYVNY